MVREGVESMVWWYEEGSVWNVGLWNTLMGCQDPDQHHKRLPPSCFNYEAINFLEHLFSCLSMPYLWMLRATFRLTATGNWSKSGSSGKFGSDSTAIRPQQSCVLLCHLTVPLLGVFFFNFSATWSVREGYFEDLKLVEFFSRAQVCFLATSTLIILCFPLFECILFYASDKSLCCAFISDVADKKAVFENTNEQATKYVAEDNGKTRTGAFQLQY